MSLNIIAEMIDMIVAIKAIKTKFIEKEFGVKSGAMIPAENQATPKFVRNSE